jgi:competence protein ComEC
MERRTVYKKTTRYVVFFLSILGGLGLARLGGEPSGWWSIVLGILAIASFRRARLISVYLLVLFGLAFGWWRGGVYMNEVNYLKTLHKQKITLVGRALNDSVYDDKGSVSFDIDSLKLMTPAGPRGIVGKVGVSGYGERMVYRGDMVSVEGSFYPGRGSYVAWMSYANMQVLAKSQSIIYSLTRHFAAGLQSALPEPQASFALGILIGQRDTLPKNTSEILAMIGLTHIIAVSGYNLTILVRSTRRIFARWSKFQSMFAACSFILVFLLITGAQPSIVRASIISILSLGAWYFGRNIKPLVIIFLTAAITAMWNPLYLWSDIGWYLSFLAFFGVLILSPILKARIYGDRHPKIMGELIIESFSAQIMTLPIILFIFGESSYVVLLANLLVVPLIPMAMLLSFVAGLFGATLPAIAGWFAWPARVILTYILDVATLVARIPNMQFSMSLGWVGMMLMYLLIGLLAVVWWQKLPKSANITEKNYFE